jgi:hypothetical protein
MLGVIHPYSRSCLLADDGVLEDVLSPASYKSNDILLLSTSFLRVSRQHE